MSLKFNITLPTEIREPESILPDNILFYGLPKCGKTTHLVTLPNHLIIDVERGAGKVAGNIIAPDENFGPVETYEWLKAVAAEIRKQNKPYDFVCVETISYLDELSEWVGTYNYMNHPQGQK